MSGINVGSISAKFGLDPAEFLGKLRGVSGATALFSNEMKRQMKESSREGAESLHLLDHMLGIQLPRSMNRLIAQEFPSFAKGLQSILGVGAAGVLGEAFFEFGEHISKKMEEAKKKQEEYTEAVQKTKLVLGETDAASEQRLDKALAKAAALAGNTKDEAHFKGLVADAEAVDQMAKSVDKLVEAELREARAKQAQMGFWAAAGAIAHDVFSFESTLQVEKINERMAAFAREFDLRSVEDQINHTTTAADLLAEATKRAHDELKTLETPTPAKDDDLMFEAAITPDQTTSSPDAIAAQKKTAETFDAIAEAQKRRQKAADQEKANAAKEAGQAHARETRTEIESIQRLEETSNAAASSAMLLADATGKGTSQTILATAAGEAQKKILDATAEANTKLFSDGSKQPVSTDKSIQAKLAEYAVIERGNALMGAASRAFAEYNRGVAEFNTRSAERLSALNATADAHGKVASEQAKELAGLVPLEEKLQSLKDLYATLYAGAGAAPAPAIGPPSQQQALAGQIASANAQLQAARDAVTKNINPKIQTGAFKEELNKIREEIASVAGGEVSPWAKMDAEVVKLTRDLQLAPDQVAELRQALTGLQNVKIGAEFEKLADKLDQARAMSAALSSGSPFGKVDAEVVKFTRELGLTGSQIENVRQALIALETSANSDKAFAGVDALNAGGGRMQELRQQMDALTRAARTGRTDDGAALSADTLAAVKLEMQAITDEQDKILLKTGGIDAGFKAWADDLQRVQSAGELTFEGLTEATKGFEEGASKSIIDILTAQRGQHLKLIHELEAVWDGYFKNLASMAIKHGLERLLAPIGKAITGGLPGAAAGAAGKDAAGASLTAAGTTLHSAAISLLSAAAALRASAVSGGGGGTPFSGGGAAGAGDAGAAVPFFAAGGDATPGSSFISGEAGAEEVDLDRSGGAHITPLGTGTGGDTHIYNDFSGTVMTDDLMRRAEAVAMVHSSMKQMMQAIPAMQREINLRKRT